MVFDVRKSFMIAPIDRRATTFDPSNEDDRDESDGGVSCRRCEYWCRATMRSGNAALARAVRNALRGVGGQCEARCRASERLERA